MKSFLASLAGIAAAILVTFLMEMAGHALFPPVAANAPTDLVAAQPLPAKLWLILAWSLGATSGAFVGTRMAIGTALPAIIVAAFMLAGIASNAMAIPHPLWMIIGGAAAALLGAVTGRQLGLGRTPAP